MKGIKHFVLATILSASTILSAPAAEFINDEGSGCIIGRVTDKAHNSLPGASVAIANGTGVTSDLNGNFRIANLKPGTYTVTISYVGFQPVTQTITIGSGDEKHADFVMNEGVKLDEVTVTGVFSNQRKALQMQKSAMGVTNVVSADQVGKFPDSNIGDALKRINGINVQYDQGEARFGQVRGTSSDLTAVTINGNRLPSAEGDTRNVQLDLIPADMIQTIEVNKVVTADMDGDAIGGGINLVTKNHPSNRVLNFTASSGYSWISEKPHWNVAGTWGDRFFGDRLGIMASASYQYAPGGSDNTEFEYVEKKGEIQLKEAQVRQYYVTRERQSYSLSLDYKFNDSHKLWFKGIYNRRNDWENRYRISYKKLNSDPEDQSIVIQSKAGANDTKSARLERQQTMDFTLGGEHFAGPLAIDWASSFARASEDRPNERYLGVKIKGSDSFDIGASIVDAGGRQPYSTLSIPSFSEGKWKIDEFTNSDQSIKENEWKERINFTLPLATGDFGNTLKFGYKYTRKEKSRNTEYYDYSDAADKYIPEWKTTTSQQIRSGFMPGSQYPIGTDFTTKEYLGAINFDKADGSELLVEEAGNKLDATLGLRMEHTRLLTSGVNYMMDADENESLTPTGDFRNNYTSLLPSLLLKYKFDKDGSLRASVTKTLSRPKYSAMIANKSFNLADLEATIGDPTTKPTTAWNIDLSADYYFKSIGVVSLGLFYKDIKNVNVETLGYYTGAELGIAGNEELFEVTQNLNAYDARIFGVEAAYQRDFSFITPDLKCLGFYGNYTFTHSTTRNYNQRLGITDADDVKMAGSPKHSANASLYFEKWGINLRLSYNYASSFIDQMNTGSRQLDRYYDDVNYLDINASYSWGRKIRYSIFAEANNLLNQPLRYYQGVKDRTMQVEYYGVKLTAGFKINL